MTFIDQSTPPSLTRDVSREITKREAEALSKIVAGLPPLRAIGPIALAAMQAVVRRPPLMGLLHPAAIRRRSEDKAMLETLQASEPREMAEVAYDLASILMRHGQQFAETDDPLVHEGLIVVSNIVKMYEHMFILQMGTGGTTDVA